MYLYSNVYLNGLVLAVAGIRAGVRPSPEPSLPDASSLHLPYDLCFASWIWDLLDFAFQLCILFRFRFGVVWGRNKGGVTLAAIRIRTFGDICIWNFTAHDKSLDYRKIAALLRNQAHLHGNQCKMNSIFQIAILTSKRRKYL